MRVALVYNDDVVSDDVVPVERAGSSVTLGTSGGETLTLDPHGWYDGFELLRIEPQRAVLRFTTRMAGWVCLAGDEMRLCDAAWRIGRAPRVLGETAVRDDDQTVHGAVELELELAPGDWGVVTAGSVEVVFQWSRQPNVTRLTGLTGMALSTGPRRVAMALIASLVVQGAALVATFWPEPVRSQGRASVERDARWVEYRVGRFEEAVERPTVARSDPAVRTDRTDQIASQEQPSVDKRIDHNQMGSDQIGSDQIGSDQIGSDQIDTIEVIDLPMRIEGDPAPMSD